MSEDWEERPSMSEWLFGNEYDLIVEADGSLWRQIPIPDHTDANGNTYRGAKLRWRVDGPPIVFHGNVWRES